MTLWEWIQHGPLRREKRNAKRLGLYQKALARRLDRDDSAPETVELLDFSSGGLKIRLESQIEVGQDIWIRARIRHVQQCEDGASESGISWDD